MINHNSNLIESIYPQAGSGSLFLEHAIAYLVAEDFTGSGSWPNRVGNAITTSGSFTDSGSAGWAFNGSGRLNLEESVPKITFDPFTNPNGITFIWVGTMGSYSDIFTPVLTINSLDGSIFQIPGGYAGTAWQYSESGSRYGMKNEQLGQEVTRGLTLDGTQSNTLSYYALAPQPASEVTKLYYDLPPSLTVQPATGQSFGYYQNDTKVVFGNFPDQEITVPTEFFPIWQRFRGTLQTLLVYDRTLTDSQIFRIIDNLRRGV